MKIKNLSKISKNWLQKNDADYFVLFKSEPNLLKHRTKHCFHNYILKGKEMLYFISGGTKDTLNEIYEQEIFKLEEISLHTLPVVKKFNPSLIRLMLTGSAFKSNIIGENFFWKTELSSGGLSYAPAFTLLFGNECDSALKFSIKIKNAIYF